jgi:hypothetical protein
MSRAEELRELWQNLKERCTIDYFFGTNRVEEEEEHKRHSELADFESPFACLPWPPIRFWVDFCLLAILGGLLGLLCLGYIKAIDSLVAQWSPVAPDQCPYAKSDIDAKLNALRDGFFDIPRNTSFDARLLPILNELRNLSFPQAFNASLFANLTECKLFPYTANSLTWAGGQPWWIAVGAGVGLVEGILRVFPTD